MAEKIEDRLLPAKLRRAEEAITRWYLRAPAGTLREHLLDPDYWVHIGPQLLRTPNRGIHDEIRVVADDGSFDVDLTVVEIDHRGKWARVVERSAAARGKRVERATPGTYPDPDGYTIEFSSAHQWRIIDRHNNVLEKTIPDEETAKARLAEIKKAKQG